MTTLVPAYGRDYKSPKAVKADWAAEKDFQIMDMSSPDNGRYANRQDFNKGTQVKIRYNKLTKLVVITV